MNRTRIAILSLCALATSLGAATAVATDLRIENVRIEGTRDSETATYVTFDISWDNAWHNEKNHDAAWVFLKLVGDSGVRHLPISAEGYRAAAAQPAVDGMRQPDARIEVPSDQTGLFIYAAERHRGAVSWRVTVQLASRLEPGIVPPANVKVFGVEMVHIPAGPFFVGDPDSVAGSYGAFFQSGGNGGTADFYRVADESEIRVGTEAGDLSYTPGQYTGDGVGPIPAAFPKGHDAFYIMKYEMTQGQYADFLNTIGDYDTFYRVHFGGRVYERKRGTIRLEHERYIAGSPNRPMNFQHWDDGLAFADWAGLRPLTEFEFTKAARGPDKPKPNAFPWGTTSRTELARIVDTDNELRLINGWDESLLSDETLPVFGASYYWVMDLAGSVWERVVTPTLADGRNFVGTHGDGQLGRRASANNDDWPHAYMDREGHGYRGGGFYDQGQEWHEFNPYSPVAFRRFGGWAGPDIARAYGFRAGRSAGS